MEIKLSDHFTYPRLLRFVLPSILTLFFTTVYSIVDGIFVSNFVGKTAFAAVNFVMPILMLLASVGVMMGAGGSALVAKLLDEQNKVKANQGKYCRIVFHGKYRLLFGCKRRIAYSSNPLWAHCRSRRNRIHILTYFLLFFYRSGTAKTKFYSYGRSGRHQYFIRPCFYRHFKMGYFRSGTCNVNRPNGWRNHTLGIFPFAQQDALAACEAKL